MNHLIKAVEEWAASRGIMDKATPRAQAMKTIEEAAELLEAICDDDGEEIRLELGDVMVTCIIGCALQGFTPDSALEAAYNKIIKRDGRMVDGQFVRDTSPACIMMEVEDSNFDMWWECSVCGHTVAQSKAADAATHCAGCQGLIADWEVIEEGDS